MSDTHNIELGKDQILWLNTYKTIDLKQWRFILVDNKPEWLYVGDWSPGPIKPYTSKRDGGYSQRQRNLESNRYFYWPRGEEEEESLKRDREEREAALVEHERLMRERKHERKPVECERCKRIYASVYSMRRHNCRVPIECERCKGLYASVYSMRRHYCCVHGKV